MRLVVFDVDGTLIDSQDHIHHAMTQAFGQVGLPPPARAQVLAIVGLSLPVAVAQLVPDADQPVQAGIVAAYRDSFLRARLAHVAPLYDGARDCLTRLAGRDDLRLAVATGKSLRGLRAMLDDHGLHGVFDSLQTADDHPSKPHPSMLRAALDHAGVPAGRALMIGDTGFDMRMAQAAGVRGIGVAWGYHPTATLHQAGAAAICDDFEALTRLIEDWAR